jgi:hypothetical protein
MSLKDITELMVGYKSRRTNMVVTTTDAEREIKEFINDPDFNSFADKPRVILGAEEFSLEITSTVLWLRSFGVDMSCVRLRPYAVDNHLVLESSVLIPLPEAREYQIRREEKDAEQVQSRPRERITPEQFLASAHEEVRPMLMHIRSWILTQPNVQEEAFKSGLIYRRPSNREWVTWLQFTRFEVRAIVRPEVEVDPTSIVRRSSGGWWVVRARSVEEAVQVESLLQRSMQYSGPVDAGEEPHP